MKRARSRSEVLVLCLSLSASLILANVGCHRREDVAADSPAPLVLKSDSEGLLLTWIDEKGDFHVVEKVSDVPLVGRDAVRVIDPTRADGTHAERIFVADLRTAGPDGAFPVKVTTRAEFDGLAEVRRQKSGPTLASAGAVAPDASAPADVADNGGGADKQPPGDPNARPAVIIYGAEWCGPCHQAAAYFRQKGIRFIEKDVDKDPNAAREMSAKLARAGIHNAGSIPVIDVRGKMMVGFNARSMDDALGQAL